jgi:hypothetical protein
MTGLAFDHQASAFAAGTHLSHQGYVTEKRTSAALELDLPWRETARPLVTMVCPTAGHYVGKPVHY